MGKQGMTRVLCAYEGNLPGSAAEKLTMRQDLESMLNQLEEEGLQKASGEMPRRHELLEESTKAMKEWQRQWRDLEDAVPDDALDDALQEAEREKGKWAPEGQDGPQPTAPAPVCDFSTVPTARRLRGKQPPNAATDNNPERSEPESPSSGPILPSTWPSCRANVGNSSEVSAKLWNSMRDTAETCSKVDASLRTSQH